MPKPGPGTAGQLAGQELCRTLKNMAQVRVIRRWSDERLHPAPPGTLLAAEVRGSAVEVVAIGASTGGPQVLRDILIDLPSDFSPPLLVVHHIAVGFDESLVDRLGHQCSLPVKIAADGQALNRLASR
jgi:two-component system chemotaxis response regulator CheB